MRTINIDMDPNTTNNLDPKLKDMYNRVMSTPVPPPVTPTPSAPTPPLTPDPVTSPNPTPPQMPNPLPQPEAAAPTPPPPIQPQPENQTPPTTEMHSTMPIPVSPKPISAAIVGGGTAKSKNMKFFPVLLAFGAIIFFGVYTVFWVKFFNLSVPFLPF